MLSAGPPPEALEEINAVAVRLRMSGGMTGIVMFVGLPFVLVKVQVTMPLDGLHTTPLGGVSVPMATGCEKTTVRVADTELAAVLLVTVAL